MATNATSATPTYEDLRQRFIDGDNSVTQNQLETAWASRATQTRFSALQSEAQAAAEQRAANKQRGDQIVALRTRADAANSATVTSLQAAYRSALTALRDLRAGMELFNIEAVSIERETQRLEADDVTQVGAFSVDSELDSLEQQSRADGPHTKDILGGAYSRLLDNAYRTEADQAHDTRQAEAEADAAARQAG